MFELIKLPPDPPSRRRLPVLHDDGELLLVLGGRLLQPPDLGDDGLQLGRQNITHPWGYGRPARSTSTSSTVPIFQLVVALEIND